MAAATGGGIPYIGSRIGLISKSEIRYEGTLYTIDTKESTVALQHVRSFGTEGRKKDGPQIAPSNEVYEYIIFRGSDIKDLHVCESPASAAPASDPAIISQGAPPAVVQPPGMPPPASGAPPYSMPPPAAPMPGGYVQPGQAGSGRMGQTAQPNMFAPQHIMQNQGQQHGNQKGGGKSAGRGGSKDAGGRGQHKGGRGQQQPGQPAANQSQRQPNTAAGAPPKPAAAPAAPPTPLEEFDFESNNARFDKEKETAELMQTLTIGGAADVPVQSPAPSMFPEGAAGFPVYDKKKDFFDSLSCEAMTERRSTGTMKEQRALDVETFGAAGNERSRYGRKGRGRGRGGKGGGNRRGGGGRGGHKQQQQSGQAQN